MALEGHAAVDDEDLDLVFILQFHGFGKEEEVY
jgi:hypothetical protein